MKPSTTTPTALSGASLVHQNWQHFDTGMKGRFLEEARLYTDVGISGEIRNLGPFSLLNTHAQPRKRGGNPLIAPIVVRASYHVPEKYPAVPMKDEHAHYHGGDMFDEIAALLSLILGLRLKAAGVDRSHFDLDPLGKPIAFFTKPEPILVQAERPQLPDLQRDGRLDHALADLQQLPARSIREVSALAKAARLYQQAVWIADSDPEFAWLLLVSCVETVAVLWSAGDGSAVDRFKLGLPALAKLLRSELSDEHYLQAAELVTTFTRSTKKFGDFLSKFSPGPPQERPPYDKVNFTPKGIKNAASIIYGHRSAYLHSGTAIPLPMCDPPQPSAFPEHGTGYSERPQGTATRAKGAEWTVKETPMLLRTFEYLARGAVLNWWRSLAPAV